MKITEVKQSRTGSVVAEWPSSGRWKIAIQSNQLKQLIKYIYPLDVEFIFSGRFKRNLMLFQQYLSEVFRNEIMAAYQPGKKPLMLKWSLFLNSFTNLWLQWHTIMFMNSEIMIISTFSFLPGYQDFILKNLHWYVWRNSGRSRNWGVHCEGR